MNTPIPPEHPHPHSLGDLFLSFTLMALQGFGGVMAIAQHELVERKRWLTREEFVEDWAVAQIMPGPNVVNLALMIGGRAFGLPGALAALAGMIAVPLVVVLLAALGYAHFSAHAGAAGALRGMVAVSAGLIGATALKLASSLKNHPLPLPLTLAMTVVGVALAALLRVPMGYLLLGLGGLGCLLTYRRLGR